MKVRQSLTALVLASMVGCLFNTITVKGQDSRHIPNCQRYRDRRGRFEITGNDDSVYCLQQHMYQSALTSSPVNASIVYVQALLQKALSRCGNYGSPDGSPKPIRRRCKKRKCPRRKLYSSRNKREGNKPQSNARYHEGRKKKCSWERKEVRMLSRSEWRRFTTRLNILKRPIRLPGGGTFIPYDVISDIHRSDPNLEAAHGGPSFLGWHRVYLLLMEAALGVPIPYWDSRLDYDMSEPTDSVLWTDEFFGPGFGKVDSGPFAGWITADKISLVRNIGSSGSLISDSMVKNILGYRKHDPVVEPTRGTVSIEQIHAGPHVWVDGQLSSLQTAPQEPVFFLHHSYVDYLWYMFRKQMRDAGNINPSSDYPNKGPRLHNRKANMIPFGDLRNIQGYSDFLEGLTRYKDSPTCPSCGRSKYLECDTYINRCKSKAKRTVILTPAAAAADAPDRRRLTSGPVHLGTKFQSPHTDSRTRGDVLRYTPLPQRTPLV